MRWKWQELREREIDDVGDCRYENKQHSFNEFIILRKNEPPVFSLLENGQLTVT